MPKAKAETSQPSDNSGIAGSCNAQLTGYIRSGKSGIYVTTYEEVRIEAEMLKIIPFLNSVKKDPNDKDWDFYIWSCTSGILKLTMPGGKPGRIEETDNPMAALIAWQEKCPERSILLARDFHAFLDSAAGPPDPQLVRQLKEVLMKGKEINKVFIICGAKFSLPIELHKEMATVEFQLPDKAQLGVVLDEFCKASGLHLNNDERDAVLDASSGLTTSEAEDAFALSAVKCGQVQPLVVTQEKANTIKKNGILELFETDATLADIGGLEILKDWLIKRAGVFSKEAHDYGLPIPKGILVTGIPGVGKSLTAKAAASILGVPLLKLDVGKVFGSLVGQSEANMRTVIETAEAIAPCVVWVDEIEKGLSGSQSSGSTDGGTSSRVFGTFLQWMQDKTAPVFVFATANDITRLPPEFLRKGRFDELFFADLPDVEDRTAIFRLHLNKRGRKADKFNIQMLAERSEGFTGAEIESVICDGLIASFFDKKRKLNDDDILESITNTVPLSRTMSAQIDGLRTWAQGRARRASAVKETGKSGRKIA